MRKRGVISTVKSDDAEVANIIRSLLGIIKVMERELKRLKAEKKDHLNNHDRWSEV